MYISWIWIRLTLKRLFLHCKYFRFVNSDWKNMIFAISFHKYFRIETLRHARAISRFIGDDVTCFSQKIYLLSQQKCLFAGNFVSFLLWHCLIHFSYLTRFWLQTTLWTSLPSKSITVYIPLALNLHAGPAWSSNENVTRESWWQTTIDVALWIHVSGRKTETSKDINILDSRKVFRYVGSKYGSNGNYDGNDRFSTPRMIGLKTKRERTLYSSLLGCSDSRKSSSLILILELISFTSQFTASRFSTLCLHSSLVLVRFTRLRFFWSNSPARDVLNFETFHVMLHENNPRNTCIGQSPHISI